MEMNEFHINNILKDMEKKDYHGYLLAQFKIGRASCRERV